MKAIRRLLKTGLIIGLTLAAALAAAGALAKTVEISFVLVNDIYLMNVQLMADGKRRGGFALLAAVVQTERAKAHAEKRHVIFAHSGDTISPALMSGIDQGAHIITLTNMMPPDI